MDKDLDLLCENYWERKKNFYTSGQLTDCNFSVGAEPNQENIAVHKIILAIASPVFEAMFYGPIPEENIIRIPDIEPEVFRVLIQYVYTEKVKISSFDDSWDLYYCAKKYMLPVLASNCIKYILANLNPKNACKVYEDADALDDKVITRKCLEIIKLQTDEILSDKSFNQVKIKTVVKVFEQETLTIRSEMDLYNAAVNYIKERGTNSAETASLTPPAETSDKISKDLHPESKNPKKFNLDLDNNQISIRTALQKIRFLTLSAEEFCKGVKKFHLLSEVEEYAILRTIILPSEETMPDGFSVSRMKRILKCQQSQRKHINMRCFNCIDY